ncbi:hypothetical protein A6V39_00565 [Candidatus Mycoplasma haematobovis]|uniref:Uncharacterized protein n=1 Tax=Candidatus Mycoplasma haematobovis TaxID=432608 RepID=A0A1A9QDJ9_9MOLU|nr:hypothetical protein [Candidatus Mycoplasma haematobovis]OAL10543.1 hypothetical protein A6V39_00565 [Candidatus Mycoplasma haematobovis]
MIGTSKLTAGVVAIGSLGFIGGAGAYIGGAFDSTKEQPKIIKTTINISQQLKTDGFSELNPDIEGGDWTEILNAYKQATNKTFSGQTEPELRAKCKEVLKFENANTNYSSAKMWCVKKEKMNAILDRGGYTTLKADEAVVYREKEEWGKKITALKNLNPKPFTELEGKIKESSDQLDHNIGLLRGECAKIKINEIDTTDATFENKFNLIKKWCSIKK